MKIRKAINKIMNHPMANTQVITLYWTDVTDIVDGGGDIFRENAGERSEEQTTEAKAFVHFVSHESVVNRGYTEIQAGDAILDFPPNINLEKPNLTFEFAGKRWQARPAGRELAAAWDTIIGGEATVRTVLVRPV